MNDFRYAVRTLLRSPAFSVVAVLALALGIGANTALFSLIEAVLLRPLPYGAPERVMVVHNRWEGTPAAALSAAEYFDYLDGTRDVFEDLGVYATGSINITGDGTPERVPAAYLTAGALRAFGVRPVAGRLFTDEEAGPGGPPVALISHGLWQRRFGGSSDIIGNDVVLDGQATTVIGVLPASFRIPEDFTASAPRDVFVPLGLDRTAIAHRGSHFLSGIARLAPAVTAARARSAIAGVAQRFVERFPDDYPRDMRFGVNLRPVTEDVVGPVRPVLLVLLGAVGFVLLIACANVASLLLARAEGRRRELAVRAALGAGRRRIARQLLVENLVLAIAGGVAGVILALWANAAVVALRPLNMPRVDEVAIDLPVLGFALLASLVTGMLFGLAPLLSLRGNPFAGLREAGRGTTRGRGAMRLRQALIVGEVALALVLLSGAGLLLRSFSALLSVDPGYTTHGVLTTRLSLPAAGYADDASRRVFFETLVRRVAGLPDVAAAGAVSNLPLASGLGDLNIHIEGREERAGDVSPRLDWQVVTPGYFEAMRMRMVRGRAIDARDDERAPGAVVINETAARTYFPNQDAIGQRFELGGNAGPGIVTVVGIVADVRHGSLADAPVGEMYMPHRQFTFWNGGRAVDAMTLVVRTTRDPAALAPAVREAIAAIDPNLPAGAFRTMEEVEATSVSQPRFTLVVLGAFAAVALMLAAIGVYGVIAYTVSQRRQELGVRMALGARPAQVIGMVLRQGLALAGLGIALGLAATLVLGRSLTGMLFRVQPTDPLTLVAVALGLAAVALAACVVPARRATRVDPLQALRTE